MKSAGGVGALLIALGVGGCTDRDPLTAIVVAVDSDISSIDRITVEVHDFGQQPLADAWLGTGEAALPRTLGLVHDGGSLGPISVTVTGMLEGGTPVIRRRASVSFVRDEVMLLRMNLLASCIEIASDCSAQDTCGENGCRGLEVRPGEMTRWGGEVSDMLQPIEPDAGSGSPIGGGTCTSHAADCDGPDGNACQDLRVDPDHCGACDRACPVAGTMGIASSECEDGTCAIACESSFLNDDGDLDTGCERYQTGFSYDPANFNAADPALMPASRVALTVDCAATFDSGVSGTQDLCGTTISSHATTQQVDGSDVVIVPLSAFTVKSSGALRVVGPRPVIFAVYGDANIAGQIDASAVGQISGAGGNAACTGIAAGPGASESSDGGGGGGGAGAGSDGAAGGLSAEQDGGQAGMARGNAAVEPLLGGCAGGQGGDGQGPGGLGGGGGGAFQLSASGTVDLASTAVVAAAGGGGQASAEEEAGGGGGGSGGVIVLEGERVFAAGGAWITANGGGGGEGNETDTATGLAGADGARASVTPAVGGAGGAPSAGKGGDGAAGTANAVAGGDASRSGLGDDDDHGGGGGGGGMGHIHLRGAASCAVSGNSSPAAAEACP